MKTIFKEMGKINIDGKSFTGRNITIINGKVTVDGVLQNGSLTGDINVNIEGDVASLDLSIGTIKANNVGSISTQSGDVYCKDVSGNVSTMSGDVECGEVKGNITSMSGDIDRK